MFILTVISEALLYICFALLIADYLFSIISHDKKPLIHVPKKIRLLAAIGIALFSFMPILDLLLYLYEDYGIGQALSSVLGTFKVGQAFSFTVLLSIMLSLSILFIDDGQEKRYPFIGLVLLLFLILGLGWASHSSSLHPVKGFIIHTIHFTAVVTWVGVLFVISWFSKNVANWTQFLKWFHPLAIICFTVVGITGLLLMQLVIPLQDYPDTWMVSYGQSILIKHLLIVPLLGYAFLNGVIMKKKLKENKAFDPRPWTKVESVVVLLIFAATGAMSHSSPPNNLASLISLEGVSPLFTLFTNGLVTPDASIELVFNVNALLLGTLAVVFMVIMIAAFRKKMSPLFSFLMSVLFILSGYLALLQSVQMM
ncbi:copper resistance D family protein [Guptibacillus hwajinpoensis]|uniref:Copper resistance protein D n=1 Tax=Guptibacillus hwajinpoensis TaxID=208199 RepID=A0ABU0JYV6_9BACL|nr:CopD family protein [Alkalihalobacillus hemicentroti]MDQ0481092.1 putative copper resistance protein D [Alkalihalobacillus hemicentroti]